MMVRTQISLDAEEHRRAKRRAAELGISLAEYVRRAVSRELKGEEPQPKADISAIIALGRSAEPTNIARDKDRMIGEAVEQEYLRKTGRSPGS